MELKSFGWVSKDEKNRRFYMRFEISKNILKSLLYSTNYTKNYKIYYNWKFLKYTKLSSISIYKRYGIFSFIGKSVFCHFKLNRHLFKFNASAGFLVGLCKSSF